MGRKRRNLTISLLAAAATAALGGAGSAQAAVTIGSNLTSSANANDPGCNSSACTAVNLSLAQVDQAPNGLTSPVNGTVISWRAATNNGFPIALRVLRPVGGTTFTGVGTSALADPAAGVTPPISTSLPIRAGDFIGLNNTMPQFIYAATGGSTSAAGAWFILPGGQLADGSTRQADDTLTNRELLVQATVEPTNTFTFGSVVRNKKKGAATITVDVPNPGQLGFSVAGGNIARTANSGTTTVAAPGPVQFLIKATGKKRKKLNSKGKVKLTATFTFTPSFGTPSTQSTKVKLKKKHK